MAEVKNTFIQSKMNQDLDGRVLPNGQYRYGKNIQISRSEAADVGALENVLGTRFLTSFGLDDCAYEIIGHFADVVNDLIYVFITDYSDSSSTKLANDISGQNVAFGYIQKNCFIGVYNNRTQAGTLLVGGDFLNFSKTFPITGVNLIEDLLFWTDNRNQPRKINVNTASGNPFELGGATGYYTNEDSISVAKYYPFESISLLKNIGGPTQWVSTMTNKTERFLPPYCVAEVIVPMGVPGNSCVLIGTWNTIDIGSKMESVGILDDPITGNPALVTNVQPDVPAVGQTTLTFDVAQQFDAGDLIYFQYPSPDFDATWPGDETFLSDKFVRFSYRFQFDDGEYSLMAPFTQACFVPKQDGYFIGKDVDTSTPPMMSNSDITWSVSETLIGDEGKAYSSSIVEFFENKIQNIELMIPSPYQSDDQIPFEDLTEKFKVKSIDIIYKESESTTAYILDTINATEFAPGTLPTPGQKYYAYDYQSRKPWKTLPAREITRVYDKVPLRALAQESSGNRIIYGNYIDKHTSPDTLSYVVSIDPKPAIATYDKDTYVRKEYQNHTVKQNRTYQVGVVLSDRYGRQSDVILSDIFDEVISGYGSTIYHPYKTTEFELINGTDTWPGDIINMIWHQTIPEVIDKVGYPGLYRDNIGKLSGIELGTSSGWGNVCEWPSNDVIGQYGATANIGFFSTPTGDIDPTTVWINESSNDWQEGEPIDSITPVLAICPMPPAPGWDTRWKGKTLIDQNTLGWYSWKVVVKQTEQDYYNCYLPGILAGWPKDLRTTGDFAQVTFPKGDWATTAHIVLINDNINKIPRDLSEVGPEQKVFGSSVKLFGRVENHKDNWAASWNCYNQQFDPEVLPDIAINLGNLTDLNLGSIIEKAGTDNAAAAPLSYPGPNGDTLLIPINWYNGIMNPIIAELSTKKEIGWRSGDIGGGVGDTSLGMIPELAIYETEPVDSNLDIYWETSTSGLISDLNYKILNEDNTVPCGISELSIDLVENDPPGTLISDLFSAVSCEGVELDNPADNTTVELVSVENGLGIDLLYKFELEKTIGFNSYRVKTKPSPDGYFVAWEEELKRTLTFTFRVIRPSIGGVTQAFSLDVQKTIVIQNYVPNQVAMYDIAGGNDARTDIQNNCWDERGMWNTCAAWSGVCTLCPPGVAAQAPLTFVVGGWQFANPYLGNSDNIYRNTYGENYNPASCWTTNNDGLKSYDPPIPGSSYTPVGIKPTIGEYLNREFRMVNVPGYGLTPWDGYFKAKNGAYGSIPGTPDPGPSLGDELVYTVARAYQVSAFFAFQSGLCPTGEVPQYSMGEIVFADGPLVGGLPSPVINLLPSAADPFNSGFSWNGWLNTSYVPTGPIYRDFADGNIIDPADPNLGGENVVGLRYLTPDTGKTHYWESLQDCGVADPSILSIQTPGPGVNEMPNSPSQAGFWYVNALRMDKVGPTRILSAGLAQAKGYNTNVIPNFRTLQLQPPNPGDPQECLLMSDMDVPIPPGRYVVTMRVTDRSTPPIPTSAAQYFEWDVPIVVNGPFIANNGNYWGNTAGFTVYDPGATDTYPWRDL